MIIDYKLQIALYACRSYITKIDYSLKSNQDITTVSY